ncbi:Uncharacterised protein [Mycobacterium tuberculosis]|uniref:Uncharacterized protein n=1 Tax=Mycobacterium tuberculosis TaxID=1773 RepID=A0A916LCK5_MYCTX|nr:Uncharacterised protein [Mycobacterium tuberculosis]COW31669.1 Uncharacterised protein [Mycobacterium tuberculosis]COY68344.1 Uncharacterised protein [Mycobacterium tuberculosis]COY75934.1 Uncharacterised protein [Mycobacterium tuberculosis]
MLINAYTGDRWAASIHSSAMPSARAPAITRGSCGSSRIRRCAS